MDQNELPLVTICTGCYNHSQYLDDFFQSIINQTYKNIELIITDDCSDDSSRTIIRKWLPILKSHLKNVIYNENTVNQGIAKTYNKMLKAAKGKYVKVFASDDILLDNGIQILVEFMENHPDINIAFGNVYSIEDDYTYGNEYEKIKLQDTTYLNSISNMHQVLLKENIIWAVGVIYRDQLFKNCGYYDEHMLYEDWDYWLTVSKTEKMVFLDEVVCLYRKSSTSISHLDRTTDKYECEKRFRIKYENRKRMIEKHYMILPDAERMKLVKESLLGLLYYALEEKMIVYSKLIWIDIMQNGEPLNLKEWLHCVLLKYGLPIIKVKRKVYSYLAK